MFTKKICQRFILLALVCFNLLTCQDRQNSSKNIKLRFMFWGGFQELEIWETAERDFEKLYPNVDLVLEYTPAPISDYDKKLRLGFINNSAPDISAIDDDLYPSYAMYGQLENLEPYLKADSATLKLDEFIPTSLASFTYHNVRYALPWDGFSTLIIYNKDIFDRHGLPYPHDDWTIDDFRKIAWQLTCDFDNDGIIDQFGCDVGFSFLELENFIWTFGGEVMDQNREYFVLNSARTIEALQFVQDLKYKFHCQPQWSENTVLGSSVQILTGKVAMRAAPCYAMLNLFAAAREGLGWDLVQMPTGPNGIKANRVSWDGIAIWSGSPYKKEAWNFIKLILSPKIQRLIGGLKRAVPVRFSDALASFVDSTTPQQEEKYLEGFKYGRVTPVTDKIGKMRHLLDRYFNRISLTQIADDSIAKALLQIQDFRPVKDFTRYEKLKQIKVNYKYGPAEMLRDLDEDMRPIFPARPELNKPEIE